MAPRAGRTARCDREAALTRVRQARAFIEVAELCLPEADDPEMPLRGVVGALAVLAGIAASDAACCTRLGQRSRGQDHSQAVALVRTVRPEGEQLARDLERLLTIKDNAQYGTIAISLQQARAAAQQARRMVATVEAMLQ